MNTKSAARTLDFFEAFSAARRPLSMTELAERLGWPLSSCFQLVRTMERRGYAYALGSRRGYYPTRRLLQHAEIIAANDPVHQVVGATLRALRDKTGETAILGKRFENQAMIVDVCESAHSVRYSAQIGELRPMHSTSIGKALLGAMSRAERDEIVGADDLLKFTATTITGREALERELEESRVRGWYTTRGENVSDLHAVSAPIQVNGQMFALSVAGPFHRFAPELERHAAALVEAYREFEKKRAGMR